MSLNIWTVAGRLARDAEQKFGSNGKSIVTFSVPVDSGWGDKKTTMWVRCNFFGDRSEKVHQYLIKGQTVAVSGAAKLSKWTNKDGVEQTNLELDVNSLELLGKADQSGGTSKPPAAPRPNQSSDDVDSDIPF